MKLIRTPSGEIHKWNKYEGLRGNTDVKDYVGNNENREHFITIWSHLGENAI
jgi:hypothetical protein